jgi:hypothetical protein
MKPEMGADPVAFRLPPAKIGATRSMMVTAFELLRAPPVVRQPMSRSLPITLTRS